MNTLVHVAVGPILVISQCALVSAGVGVTVYINEYGDVRPSHSYIFQLYDFMSRYVYKL